MKLNFSIFYLRTVKARLYKKKYIIIIQTFYLQSIFELSRIAWNRMNDRVTKTGSNTWPILNVLN